MKKTLLLALVAVIGMVSCNKSELVKPATGFTVKAICPQETRVAYTGGAGEAIQPTWEVNDAIVGWDNCGNSFTFKVTSVTGGAAELSVGKYTPGEATKLYAVYYPGITTSSIKDGEIAVDLSSQSGALGTKTPVLMCATAAIEGGSATLKFENKTAIIGITAFKVDAEQTITRFEIDGLNTKGKFAVQEGKLELITESSISPIQADGLKLTSGTDGKVAANLYFAALPTESATISMNAYGENSVYLNSVPVASTDIAAGSYYHMSKSLTSIAVAEIGGTSYYDIAEAFEAATASASDCKITILADCVAKDALIVNNAAAKVTVDLAGKTITGCIQVTSELLIEDSSVEGTGKMINDGNVILGKNGAKTTITGGTFESTSTLSTSGGSPIKFYEDAKDDTNPVLTITAGKVIYPKGYAIYLKYGTLTCEEGTEIEAYRAFYNWSSCLVTINGGKYTLTNGLGYVAAASGTFVINDGEFTTTANNFLNNGWNGSCNIYGGKFTWGSGDFFYSSEGKPTTNNFIWGGYFSNEIKDHLGDRCVCVADETYTGLPYKVIESTDPVIKVGADSYTDIAAALTAINAAASDVAVEVLKDFVLTQVYDISNSKATVTFDFAGKTITVNDTLYYFNVAEGSKVVFKDTKSSDGGIEHTKVGLSAIAFPIVVAGELTIDGGKYGCPISSIYGGVVDIASTGSVTMNGGLLSGCKCIRNSGTLSIAGGTVDAKYSASNKAAAAGYCLNTLNGGKSAITGGTLTSIYTGSTDGAGIVAVQTTGEGSTLTVSNCAITGDKYGSLAGTSAVVTFNEGSKVKGKYASYLNGKSVVTVNGGEFANNGNVTFYVTNATLNIGGGTITHSIAGTSAVYGYSGSIVNISGGHISSSVGCGFYCTRETGAVKPQINITGGIIESTGPATKATTSCGVYPYTCEKSSISGNAIIKSANCFGAYFRNNSLCTITINGGYFSGGNQSIYKDGSYATVNAGYFDKKVTSWPASTSVGEDGEWTNGTGDGIKYIYHIKPKAE